MQMKILANKDSLLNLTYHWLNQFKVNIHPSSLKKALHSHPDYPSLAALTDTLDGYRIENAALRIDPEQIREVPTPFLAHVVMNYQEDFALIEKLDDNGVTLLDVGGKSLTKSYEEFNKMWKGVVVLMEPDEKSGDPEAAVFAKKAEKKNLRFQLLGAAIILVSILSVIAAPAITWQHIAALVVSLLGVGISYLILLHEMGEDNAITHKLCNTDNNAGCDAVLKSKGAKLFGWLGLEDAAIVYFSGLFLSVAVAGITGGISQILPLLGLIGAVLLPITGYSLYYQKFVVKKWCIMCLIVVSILWLNFALLLPSLLDLDAANFNISTLSFLATTFLIPILAWMFLKPLVFNEAELEKKDNAYLKLKRNTDIFWGLWDKQRQVDARLYPDDVILGNPQAPLAVVAACNPYCGPCGEGHRQLEGLLKRFGNKVAVCVRFTIKTGDKADRKTEAVRHILQVIQGASEEKTHDVLHDWYEKMDYESFAAKWPLPPNPPDVEDLLKKHEAWAEKSSIEFTPTFFVNGREMPKLFTAADLEIVAGGLIGTLEDAAMQEETEPSTEMA